nr:putative zinc finger, CCHC-type [Tanacetum cinerariifolium]
PSPCHLCPDDTLPMPPPTTITPLALQSPSSPAASAMPSHAQPPANTHPMTTRAKAGISTPWHFADLALLNQNPLHVALLVDKEPKGYKSAAENFKWITAMKEAMKEEMAALKHNDM